MKVASIEDYCFIAMLHVDNFVSRMEQQKGIFLYFLMTSFEPGGIYSYRVIKQNLNRGYHGTEYSVSLVLSSQEIINAKKQQTYMEHLNE